MHRHRKAQGSSPRSGLNFFRAFLVTTEVALKTAKIIRHSFLIFLPLRFKSSILKGTVSGRQTRLFVLFNSHFL